MFLVQKKMSAILKLLAVVSVIGGDYFEINVQI